MISPFTLSVSSISAVYLFCGTVIEVWCVSRYGHCVWGAREVVTLVILIQIEHSLGTDHSDERAMDKSEVNYDMTLRHHFIVSEVHLIIAFNLPKNPDAVII